MEPPTCVSLHHKADILVVLGLDANACSAMELQGSQFLSEPRHFFAGYSLRELEESIGLN